MAIDFSGVLAKIERAYEHMDALKEEIVNFSRRYPYGLRHDIEDEGRRHVGWVDIYRQPDPIRYGIIIGDCAHNFRSALDHLVRTVARSTLSDATFGRHEGDLAFPICTAEEAWKHTLGRHRLEGITGPVLGEIEGRQPFKTHDPPEISPLAVLQWLDDRDKHRLIHAVSGYVVPTALATSPPLVPKRFRLEIAQGPYTERSTKAFELTLLDPIPNMQVNLTPALQVFIRDAAMSEDVRIVFEKIGQTVQRIAFEVAKKSAASLN